MTRARLFTVFAISAVAGLAATSALARPGPCVSFQVLGTGLDLNYNPFSPTPVNRQFQLKVTRLDPSISGVRYILVDGTPDGATSRIGPAGPRDYNLIWLGNTGQTVFYDTPQAISSLNSISTQFGNGPGGNVETVPLQLHIPQGQPVAASLQFEDVEVVYQCVSGNTSGDQESQYDNRFRIRLSIPRYFGAYVGGLGRTHGEIDFGTLNGDTATEEKHVSVTAVSTAPYSVAITTDRGSTLRRGDHSPDGIPYTMKFAEIPVTDNSQLACPMTHSSLGDTEQLKVKLDGTHLHDLPAGGYRDTITLTFTPLDVGGYRQQCELVP